MLLSAKIFSLHVCCEEHIDCGLMSLLNKYEVTRVIK